MLKIIRSEKDSCQRRQEKSQEDLKDFLHIRKYPIVCHNFKINPVDFEKEKWKKIQGIHQAPKNKGPICTVPKATQQKDDEHISDLFESGSF